MAETKVLNAFIWENPVPCFCSWKPPKASLWSFVRDTVSTQICPQPCNILYILLKVYCNSFHSLLDMLLPMVYTTAW